MRFRSGLGRLTSRFYRENGDRGLVLVTLLSHLLYDGTVKKSKKIAGGTPGRNRSLQTLSRARSIAFEPGEGPAEDQHQQAGDQDGAGRAGVDQYVAGAAGEERGVGGGSEGQADGSEMEGGGRERRAGGWAGVRDGGWERGIGGWERGVGESELRPNHWAR